MTTASEVSRDGRRSVNASSRRGRRGTIAVRGSVIQLSSLVDRHVDFRLAPKTKLDIERAIKHSQT